MTKGFTINDILSTSSTKKKQTGLMYQKNITLSYTPYSGFDLGKDSHQYKGGFNVGFGSSISSNKSSYNDKPMMMANTKPKESFRPASSMGSMGGWNHSNNQIPVHKKGQVEATRKSKPRKTQTVFSTHQLSNLEQKYFNNNYISTEERNHIAQTLHMSVPQVKNWFQNKRNKERKMGKQPNRNHLNIGAPHCDYLNRAAYLNLPLSVSKYY